MYRTLLILLLVLAAPLSAKPTVVPPDELVPAQRHRDAAIVMVKVISRYHYRRVALDDAMSEKIFERYLEALDPNKSFFTAQDVSRFRQAWLHQMDDALKRARLEPVFNIYRVFRQRVEERVASALHWLEYPFDFERDEVYEFDRSEADWAGDEQALDELWRKRVKNDVLGLRLADKPADKILETLKKRYEGILHRAQQFNSDDIFQAFANAYTLALEPHTGYMSPRSAENFDISMRLSLEGIGAVLSTDNEFTVVERTVLGGPAARSGQIKEGDRIVGVAQGRDGEMIDVVGWRLQDVVERIRGPKGSTVRLAIRPKVGSSGPSREVVLVRDKIKLEDQAAKKSIIDGLPGAPNVRIGVIELPAFYRDFAAQQRGEKDFRSTTRDVRRLLKELMAEGVDGIVMDLRNNGGGSLTEATELTGLFIDKGPVVQVKDSGGEVEVERDDDPALVYGGPLAVLVNRNSASASEIFAGAIQDYKRGVVIGEPTFGKGTVQTLIDLGRFVRGDADLGRLRLTMAQFFRISGASTQHRGVIPDVVLPTAAGSEKHGERSLDNALPWAQIQRLAYQPRGIGAYQALRVRNAQRVGASPGFAFLQAQEKLFKKLQDEKVLSLKERERKLQFDRRERERLAIHNAFRASLKLPALTDDMDEEALDEALQEDEKKLAETVLNEAAQVLIDYIELSRVNRPRAAQAN